MEETRPCPYCGEPIRAEAIRCRYCRSRLAPIDPERWHRDHPDRRVAGVAAAVAHAFALPPGAVRLGFIVASFVHFLGPVLYGALWLLIPFAPGEPSPFERSRAAAESTLAQARAHWRARPRACARRTEDRPQANGSASGLPASLVP